jgi:hypothetical protein
MADGQLLSNGRQHTQVIKANASISNVETIFSSNRYDIPPYQRDFSWEKEQVDLLLTDLLEAFDSGGPNRNERKQEYFLGPVITQIYNGPIADKIIDGQQRLTSIMILIAVLCLYGSEETRTSALTLIYRPDEDNGTFVISGDDHNKYLRKLMWTVADHEDLGLPERLPIQSNVKSAAIQRFERAFVHSHEFVLQELTNIDEQPDGNDRLNTQRVDQFFNWICTAVFFAHIQDPAPFDEQRLFDRMNTRGLPLSEAQKFMSKMLSDGKAAGEKIRPQIWRKARQQAMDALNTDKPRGLTRDIMDAEKRLLGAALIACRMDHTLDETSRLRTAKRIKANPYEWFLEKDHVASIEADGTAPLQILKNTYFTYASKAKSMYGPCHKYTSSLEGFQHAEIAKLPFFDATLAAAAMAQTRYAKKKRMQDLSKFLDVIALHYAWNSKTLSRPKVELKMLEAVRILVSETGERVKMQLFGLLAELPDIATLDAPSRNGSNRIWMHYILARMEVGLTRAINGPKAKISKMLFETTGANAHQTEHIISKNYGEWGPAFKYDADVFLAQRERLGALSILSAPMNIHVRNKPFQERTATYESAGWLSRVLTESSYRNGNGELISKQSNMPSFGFHSWEKITIENIEDRELSMVRLASYIWKAHRVLES